MTPKYVQHRSTNRSKMHSGGVLRPLGASSPGLSWGLLGRSWLDFWAPRGAKRPPEALLDRILVDFGTPGPSKNLKKCCTVVKNQGFRAFVRKPEKAPKWSPKLAPSWPKLTPIWPKLAPSWPKLARSWPKFVPSWLKLGPSWFQVGLSWLREAQVGPTWPQVGSSWPQDGPSWPPEASKKLQVGSNIVEIGATGERSRRSNLLTKR